MPENGFPIRRKWSPLVTITIVACAACAVYGVAHIFFGSGGDLRRLRLRILVNGSGERHTFDEGSNLARESFKGTNLRWSYFPAVDLAHADFDRARLKGATFTQSSLVRANLRNAELVGARLNGCDCEGADLRGADLRDADLSGSSFRFALLAQVQLRNTNLAGADFSGAIGLPVAQMKLCHGWHLARYDDDTISMIRQNIPLAALKKAGVASWDDWMKEQKRLAVSPPSALRQPPEEAAP
jgi:uncharacterized protein YjbI with pentapeptide repeats